MKILCLCPCVPSQTMYLLNAVDIPYSRPGVVPEPVPVRKGEYIFMDMMMPVQSVEDLEPYTLMQRKYPIDAQPLFSWQKVGS